MGTAELIVFEYGFAEDGEYVLVLLRLMGLVNSNGGGSTSACGLAIAEKQEAWIAQKDNSVELDFWSDKFSARFCFSDSTCLWEFQQRSFAGGGFNRRIDLGPNQGLPGIFQLAASCFSR